MKPKRQINLDPDRLDTGHVGCAVPLVIVGALALMALAVEVVVQYLHCCYFIGR